MTYYGNKEEIQKYREDLIRYHWYRFCGGIEARTIPAALLTVLGLFSFVLMVVGQWWIFGGPLTFLWILTPALFAAACVIDYIYGLYADVAKPIKEGKAALNQFWKDGKLTREVAHYYGYADLPKLVDQWNELHPDKKIDLTKVYL